MTIKEFVLSQQPMGINEWISVIREERLTHLEDIVISCADKYGKITINHDANFLDAILIKKP